MIYRVLYIPGGCLGFRPPTAVWPGSIFRELWEWKGQESCSRVFLQLKLTAHTWGNLPKKETMINNGCSPVPNLLVAVIISCKEATISYKCTPQKSNITKNSHVLKGVTFSKPSTLEHGSHPIAFPPNNFDGAGTRNGLLISVQKSPWPENPSLWVSMLVFRSVSKCSLRLNCLTYHEFLQGGGLLSESHGKTDTQTHNLPHRHVQQVWQVFVLFLGIVKWPFKSLSDLQMGDQRSHWITWHLALIRVNFWPDSFDMLKKGNVYPLANMFLVMNMDKNWTHISVYRIYIRINNIYI